MQAGPETALYVVVPCMSEGSI